MCLSVPAMIKKIDGENAKVETGGNEYDASIMMLDDVKVGDYVLVHTGFALQKISEEEAMETFKLINELEEFNKAQDENNNEIH
jgi:hydrogenase expression/formation protein HypC